MSSHYVGCNNRHYHKSRAPKSEPEPEPLSLTDKAQIVLDWSWEIRDVVGLATDLGVLVLVQHAINGAVILGVGSILIGIAVVRLKQRGK